MDDKDQNELSLSSEEQKWILTQAYIRLTHNQYQQAITLLKGLELLHPSQADLYPMLSFAYLENNQPEESILMVDKYCEITGHDVDKTEELMWIKNRANLRLNTNKTDKNR